MAVKKERPPTGILKRCSSCKEEKDNSLFSFNKSTKDGFSNQCKVCEGHTRLKAKFGITPQQYQELYDKQNGCCAVCGKTELEEGRKLAVDHDHKTGEIFGLLCSFCNNRFIGRFRNPDRYRNAAIYLSKGTGWIVPKKKKRKKRCPKKKKSN